MTLTKVRKKKEPRALRARTGEFGRDRLAARASERCVYARNPRRPRGGFEPPRVLTPTSGYCAGTYVGSLLLLSITEPYAVTRPLPPTTSTVTRAL